MKANAETLATGAVGLRSQLLDYLQLMKPELTGLSVLTALCGFYLGMYGSFDLVLFLSLAAGTLFVGGGAGALNQYIEREYDAKMRRTERRPLPSGRLSPKEALLFGIVLSVGGILLLALAANLLTGFLAVLTITTYLFLYTPLKRITHLSTWVGGIPGAVPPLMGWTAVTNSIAPPGLVLFAILFFWQIPHFHSLGWLYRKDYARAGFRMLSVLDVDGSKTGNEILFSCATLIPTSLALTFVGTTGMVYFVAAATIGIIFFGCGFLFARSSTRIDARGSAANTHARRIFSASLLYLPVLMLIIGIDKV